MQRPPLARGGGCRDAVVSEPTATLAATESKALIASFLLLFWGLVNNRNAPSALFIPLHPQTPLSTNILQYWFIPSPPPFRDYCTEKYYTKCSCSHPTPFSFFFKGWNYGWHEPEGCCFQGSYKSRRKGGWIKRLRIRGHVPAPLGKSLHPSILYRLPCLLSGEEGWFFLTISMLQLTADTGPTVRGNMLPECVCLCVWLCVCVVVDCSVA